MLSNTYIVIIVIISIIILYFLYKKYKKVENLNSTFAPLGFISALIPPPPTQIPPYAVFTPPPPLQLLPGLPSNANNTFYISPEYPNFTNINGIWYPTNLTANWMQQYNINTLQYLLNN